MSVQADMKKDLREVYWRRAEASAEAAVDVSPRNSALSTAGAVEGLIKDREALLASGLAVVDPA